MCVSRVAELEKTNTVRGATTLTEGNAITSVGGIVNALNGTASAYRRLVTASPSQAMLLP